MFAVAEDAAEVFRSSRCRGRGCSQQQRSWQRMFAAAEDAAEFFAAAEDAAEDVRSSRGRGR